MSDYIEVAANDFAQALCASGLAAKPDAQLCDELARKFVESADERYHVQIWDDADTLTPAGEELLAACYAVAANWNAAAYAQRVMPL